jgi:hypothetical protein
MERLTNQQVLDASLVDWRKLAQALHARYLVPITRWRRPSSLPWQRSPKTTGTTQT